jgi:hypothetical protein
MQSLNQSESYRSAGKNERRGSNGPVDVSAFLRPSSIFSPDMSNLLPPPRRIVTAHHPFPSSSSPSSSFPRVEPAVQILFDDAFDGRVVWHGALPAQEDTHEDRSHSNHPPSQVGIVRRDGSTCRVTSLAPGEVTPMVGLPSFSHHRLLFRESYDESYRFLRSSLLRLSALSPPALWTQSPHLRWLSITSASNLFPRL